MVLYKKSMADNKRTRQKRELAITIDEPPKRDPYHFKTAKEKVKFIHSVEMTVRHSMEYRDYIKFLKRNTDLRRCEVLRGLSSDNGRHYTIEIHHEPFTLFDIVETVVNRREQENESLSPLLIADEVMGLHYDGKVGLIHLSSTMHGLVHDDKIFIPLQYIFQAYDKFYSEYKDYINPIVEEKLSAKVELSLKSDEILSDSIDPMFTYIKIDGFGFPQIPDEWKDVMKTDREGATHVKDDSPGIIEV